MKTDKLLDPKTEEIAKLAEPKSQDRFQEMPIRVLIVEDSPTQAKLLDISLKRLGVEVEWLGTLTKTLSRLESTGVDVILLDLSLPDSSGLETFHKVHALDTCVPIVVLTSLDDQRIALEAVKSGAQDYLIKGRASDDSVVRCLRYAIERNRVEVALRESERRTRLIIENSLDAFFSIDRFGTIIDWNLQAENTFGWTRLEALGKPFTDLIAPAVLRGRNLNTVERIISQEGLGALNTRQEVLAVHKTGREFPIEYGFFSIRAGQDDIYCTFASDISARKQAERKRKQINDELEQRVQERTVELQRSNEELHQFAKIASHDLQEPLRAIEGFVHLLIKRYKGKLDKDADEFMDFIMDGTIRMQELIQAVLEHSRIGTDEGEKEPPLTDVNSVLTVVRANLNKSITDSGAELKIASMPTVAVERSQLIQLFQNLVSNAIKYTGPQRPRITITAELSVNEWMFSVQDNGIGIDSQYADKIFDMFARLHGQTRYSGTGMGLAICKKIVNTHGGRIWMESVPGEGSIFYFTLPAAAKE
jgi:PAS domain S-box-containing protein